MANKGKTVVLTDLKFENWVLGGNSRDIYDVFKNNKIRIVVDFSSTLSRIKATFWCLVAQKLIFVNQNTFYRFWYLRSILKLIKVEINLLYTHSNADLNGVEVFMLNLCKKIVVLNRKEKNFLIVSGITSPEILIQPTGVDFEKFRPDHSKINGNKILVVSAYAERKNPWLLFETFNLLSNFKFLLIGQGWDKFEMFSNMIRLDNVEYEEYDTNQYVHQINKCSVFLSLSSQEGGPLPLLETMACNLTPVVTPVGYAVDIIESGRNGFLLPLNPTVENISTYLEKAFLSNFDTRSSILHLTYEKYLEKFQ